MLATGFETRIAAAGLVVLLGLHAVAPEARGQDEPSFRLAPPARHVMDAGVSEAVHARVQAYLSATLLAGIRRFDWQLAASALAVDFRGRFPHPREGRAVADDLLGIRQYEPGELAVVGRDAWLAAVRAHVEPWVSVDRASWQAFEFLLAPDGARAFARAHLQLGGPGGDGSRTAVEATVALELEKAAADAWVIGRLDVAEAFRVAGAGPGFRDITDAVGLHFNRSPENDRLRRDIADTGTSLIDSALGVVDWNRDGHWDILVTEAASHAILFLNDGRGGFVRERLPFRDDRLIPSQLLFVDLDGDGLEEIVGSRVTYAGARAWMGIYTRRGGDWLYLPRALEFDNPPGVRRSEAQFLVAGDVDGNSLVDIFAGGYQTNRSGRPEAFNRVDANDGADNLLFINRGGLRFTEESDERGITGTRHTYVAQPFDLDGDGDLDLFEGNDFGRNLVWDNRGEGTFRALADHPLARDTSNTMGVTVADWDNTGAWGIYLSNMYSHAGHRVVGLAGSVGDAMQARLRVLAQGNQLFARAAADGVWADRGVPLGVNEAGWAWGAHFLDLDNDGDKEIFVTNGNTSHADPETPDF